MERALENPAGGGNGGLERTVSLCLTAKVNPHIYICFLLHVPAKAELDVDCTVDLYISSRHAHNVLKNRAPQGKMDEVKIISITLGGT